MADPTRVVRVSDPADPRRCLGSAGQKGQCDMVAIEGSKFCPMHAGAGNYTEAKKEARNFRLLKWQSRVEEFADNEKVKSLREEIGITRVMLEEIWNRCNDATELILYSGKISSLVGQIERLVVSCHRLEERTGMLMDKSAALNLAGTFVEIIGKHVVDPTLIDAISGDMIAAIAAIHSVPKPA